MLHNFLLSIDLRLMHQRLYQAVLKLFVKHGSTDFNDHPINSDAISIFQLHASVIFLRSDIKNISNNFY